jgi:hypothetical protein
MNEKQTMSQIAIFTNEVGDISVDVRLDNDTVWLTQNQIAELFQKERSVITKHIRNVLKESYLDNSVCAKFAHTGSDGKNYQTSYYNLDMIISPGHFYVSLQKNEDKQYFVKYPQSIGFPGMLLGKEVISSREEELQRK